MSEQILNGTSAQFSYTVPFTLVVYTGRYVTEDKSKTDITETKHNPEKANNTKHSKTKLAWFSRLYKTRPGNKVGLFYNAPKLTRAHCCCCSYYYYNIC